MLNQLDQFTFIGVFLIVALIFGIAPPALAFLVRSRKTHPREAEIYERDLQTHDETRVRFKAQHDAEVQLKAPFEYAYAA